MPFTHRVVTSSVGTIASLVDILPYGQDVCCWVRQGAGMVGFGGGQRRTCDSSAAAEAWWNELIAPTEVCRDESLADEPMAGPVGFISFPFSPEGQYEVVVPRIVVGQRHGMSWVTTWDGATWTADTSHGDTGDLASSTRTTENRASDGAPTPMIFHHGCLSRQDWIGAVSQAIAHIHDGDVEKVVLARDEYARADSQIDLRVLLARLAAAYPQTWTFAVKNLVGASPELLVRQDRGLITSRVLAGTIHGDLDEPTLVQALSSSSKDLAEHEYAVESVVQALRSHVTSLHVPEVPFVLQLPNVMHLASDITGAARPGATVLELACAIHPSAAVCGTPTERA
ncbi:MAG: chorismate-binding protein, partial [Propionibacteriaceae bacterium]|nr:chorismate-binding protein [Propionibacteriaceae bacterium]